MGKLAEMLEGVKRECEQISVDAGMWKEQRDEMEAKSELTPPPSLPTEPISERAHSSLLVCPLGLVPS